MFTGLPVWYIPWRYVSTHNHTTMENQRMSWRCVKNGAKQDISPPGFISLGCRCVLCVYLGSLSCPCWDPWPRPSSYIREAWKRALGHLERPISSQRTGYREVLREDGDWETAWETTGRVDECGRQLGEWTSEQCVQVRGKAQNTLGGEPEHPRQMSQGFYFWFTMTINDLKGSYLTIALILDIFCSSKLLNNKEIKTSGKSNCL